MALSSVSLNALKIFEPYSLLGSSLVFLEFLKYETDDIRNDRVINKEELFLEFYDLIKKSPDVNLKSGKSIIKEDYEKFIKKLDKLLLLKEDDNSISEIKWDDIEKLCDLFRRIERSDERKTRWAIYYLFGKGKNEILLSDIAEILKPFNITNYEKIIKRIIKIESRTGLEAKIDNSKLLIFHKPEDKLASHYLVDALEEPTRRSKGELEKNILHLLDEGSYSNQEISKILSVDEAMVSRVISKLRNNNKIILSSFGDRGSRYYTTNCENCPFGTTKSACRKEALSYIITILKEDYGLELSIKDFENVETNQALLAIKRIFMMSRKDKRVKLERNLHENLSNILSSIVDKSLLVKPRPSTPKSPVEVKITSNLHNLPSLYQLGLKEGANRGIQLMDDILKIASKSVNKEDRIRMRKHAISETNKFLKNIGID